MRETDSLRRIVLTVSAAALAPGRFQGPYRSAKAAVSIGETLDLELGPDGIGTTIVFPSGMLHPALLDASETGDVSAAGGLTRTPEARTVLEAVAEEMAPDPTDIRTGTDAAAPVIEAVLAGPVTS